MNEAEDILSMLGGQSSVDILQLMAEDDDLNDASGAPLFEFSRKSFRG